MKAIHKDYFRELRTRKGQFISMFLIIFIGAAFFSGIRSARSSMEYTAHRFFEDNNFMEISVVSTTGLDKNDLNILKKIDGVKNVYPSFSVEALNNVKSDIYVMKVISYDKNINTPILKEGRLLKSNKECLIDEDYAETTGLGVGDFVELRAEGEANINDSLKNCKYKIVGIVNMPQYMAIARGAASIGNGSVDNFMVINEENFKLPYSTEAYVVTDYSKEYELVYDKDYLDYIELVTNRIKKAGITTNNEACENGKWYVSNRDDNIGFHEYKEESLRAESIGETFPVIFFIIAALISLTSMTRLVEDERREIGIIKALGYSDGYVYRRYISYALIPTIAGSVLGVLFGEKFFPYVIMQVYYVLYTGNETYFTPYNWYYGGLAIGICVISSVIVTTIACSKTVMTKACDLMRPKSPSIGRRFIFEGVKAWKELSFIVKSSIRNIFRYKKRLIMTIVGISGCMGLIVVACGLNDSIKVIPTEQFDEILTYDVSTVLKEGLSKKEKKEVYDKLAKYDKIDYVVNVYSSNVTLKNGKKDVEASLMCPEKSKVFEQCIAFRNRDTSEVYEMPIEGAVLSEKAAELLGVSVGEKIKLDIYGEKEVEIKVVSITETYFHHYIYISKTQYEKSFDKKFSANQIYGVYNEGAIVDIDKFNDDIKREFSGDKGVEGVIVVKDLADETDDMVQALNSIVYILWASAALLTLVVIYNLNSINITERKMELSTLKVLGFYHNEVANYVFRENVILTFVGVILGIFVGKYLHRFIIEEIEMNEVMFGVVINRFSFLLSATVTIIFTFLVNLIMNYKIKRIDMIETLKCGE